MPRPTPQNLLLPEPKRLNETAQGETQCRYSSAVRCIYIIIWSLQRLWDHYPRVGINKVQPADERRKDKVLDRLQDEDRAVIPPSQKRHQGADQGVGQEVVRSRDDGDDHGGRPQGSQDTHEPVGGEAADADGQEQGRAKVQARHGRYRELEPVAAPHGRAPGLAVQDVDEAVLLREQPRRRAPPQGDDDEGDGVVGGDGPPDAAERARREVRVGVDEEAHADADVRAVDPGEAGHEPGLPGQDVRLEPLLDVDAEEPLQVEDLEGVLLGAGEDGFVACNRPCGEGSQTLIYPMEKVSRTTTQD